MSPKKDKFNKGASSGFNDFKKRSMDFINGPMSRAFTKFGSQRHLIAIRNGLFAVTPITIIGAIATLIRSFPLGTDYSSGSRLTDIMPPDVANMFLYIYFLTLGLVGLLAAWAIASELAKSYKLSQTTSGLLGVTAFLLMIIPTIATFASRSDVNLKDATGKVDVLDAAGLPIKVGDHYSIADGPTINLTSEIFAGKTIFTAIVCAIVAVEIQHFCTRFRITIKMPAGVPDAVANSFAVIVPALFVIFGFAALRYVAHFDLTALLQEIVKPISSFLGDLGGVILAVFFVTIFWWLGIHGSAMVGLITAGSYNTFVTDNAKWTPAQSSMPPFEANEQFTNAYVWIGGAGGTLGLIIAGLFFARKSKQLKSIVRISAIPGIFNINEPIIYGIPIMINPFLFVPFLVAPIINAVVSFYLQRAFKTYVTLGTLWTLPAPVQAYFGSKGQWQAIIISLISIAISVLVWTPFTIYYDRRLAKEEKRIEEEQAKAAHDKAAHDKAAHEKVAVAKK